MHYLLAGMFLLPFGWLAQRLLHLRLRGVRAVGTVVALVKDDSEDGADTFTPIVAFTTTEGTEITAKSIYGTSGAGTHFRVGDRVDIWYSGKNPQVFAIAGYDSAALLVIGLIAAIVVGAIYYSRIS